MSYVSGFEKFILDQDIDELLSGFKLKPQGFYREKMVKAGIDLAVSNKSSTRIARELDMDESGISRWKERYPAFSELIEYFRNEFLQGILHEARSGPDFILNLPDEIIQWNPVSIQLIFKLLLEEAETASDQGTPRTDLVMLTQLLTHHFETRYVWKEKGQGSNCGMTREEFLGVLREKADSIRAMAEPKGEITTREPRNKGDGNGRGHGTSANQPKGPGQGEKCYSGS